jgi:hypothetical protein
MGAKIATTSDRCSGRSKPQSHEPSVARTLNSIRKAPPMASASTFGGMLRGALTAIAISAAVSARTARCSGENWRTRAQAFTNLALIQSGS